MRNPAKSKSLIAALVVVTAASALTGISVAAVKSKTAATTVTVTFTDKAFRVAPSGIHSGATTFVVRNTGKKSHIFEISGPGLKGARTSALPSGKSAKLTVNLRTGSYMLSDPVGLGPYSVQYVDVIRAVTVTANGQSSVTNSPVVPPPMCGGVIAP
jgi:Cupredoxin-like domain